MAINHIAHIVRRRFLRNAADPDLPNFWIAQATAIHADHPELTRTSRPGAGEPHHPAHHAIDTIGAR